MNNINTYTKPLEKFPNKEWAIIAPISLSKVLNDQSPENIKETLYDLLPKVKTPGISVSILHTTSLYGKFDWDYRKWERITEQTNRTLINSLSTEVTKPLAINMNYLQFINRSQLRLLALVDIEWCFNKLSDIYENDSEFQELMKLDCQECNRELSNEQINFFLEEHLITTLVSRNKIIISQTLVQNPKWQLRMYPGAPLRHQVYMMQKRIWLGSPNYKNWIQQYEYSWYNSENKLMYDMSKIDLDTYKRDIWELDEKIYNWNQNPQQKLDF